MTAADKLRAWMIRTKSGWTVYDLDRLYRGFGFQIREGGKHRIDSHPRYPELRTTVARASPLAVGYVETALDLLDRLDALHAKESEEPE